MIEITDFEKHADMPAATIDRFKGQVPDDLIDIWERYGVGSFGGGFFRLIDPVVYLDLLGEERLGRANGPSVPIFATGLADLVCYEEGERNLGVLLFRDQLLTGAGSVRAFFVNLNYDGPEKFATTFFHGEVFFRAVELHGELPYEESFTYVPLLSLGGDASPRGLQKRETIAAIRVLIEFQGPLAH